MRSNKRFFRLKKNSALHFNLHNFPKEKCNVYIECEQALNQNRRTNNERHPSEFQKLLIARNTDTWKILNELRKVEHDVPTPNRNE